LIPDPRSGATGQFL